MDTFPVETVHVYISSLMGKPENLKKFMIIAIASNAFARIGHARDDEHEGW